MQSVFWYLRRLVVIALIAICGFGVAFVAIRFRIPIVEFVRQWLEFLGAGLLFTLMLAVSLGFFLVAGYMLWLVIMGPAKEDFLGFWKFWKFKKCFGLTEISMGDEFGPNQGFVDKWLTQLAIEFQIWIDREQELLLTNPKTKEVRKELKRICPHLRLAKTKFWQAHRVAKGVGMYVESKYTGYLNK